jgi:hypothetical protein
MSNNELPKLTSKQINSGVVFQYKNTTRVEIIVTDQPERITQKFRCKHKYDHPECNNILIDGYAVYQWSGETK